ncbi:MAG: hypothetical protein JNL16_05580 [Dechloromonas sp.]|nr:hypothetical protein [Dechloromonas sp.]
MRFIVFGLQRTVARGNETPWQAAFSLSGCVHVGDEGKGDSKVLINKWPRVFY